MGTGEEAAASKPSKPATSTQEVSTQPAYPDWSQAYYGAGGTPPFFASTVASPTPHPYLWGGQHPMIPPYGTPVPYPHMYPPGGVYAHPSMTTVPGSAQTTPGLEKSSNGKEGASSKKNKGVSGNGSSVGSKAGDGVKATSGSGNDASSHSGESGSEGSSDANEDNQQEFGTRKPGGSGPGTNLNMGMDLWNASTSGASKRPNSAVPGAMMSDQWVQQDERELKRQRRKQSNRESARRSRLRKQAECEELQVRVESLTNENSSLKEELQRLSEECDKLTSDNTSIKEELTRICGTDAVAALERNGSTIRPRENGEDDS